MPVQEAQAADACPSCHSQTVGIARSANGNRIPTAHAEDCPASATTESLNVSAGQRKWVDMGVFEVRIEGNAHVMVSGELDLRTAPQLVSAVESLAGTEVQRVEVDLSRVTFMDSSGVSALCLAKAKLEVDGTVLVLRELSTPVDAVLRMCGLENEFVRDPGAS